MAVALFNLGGPVFPAELGRRAVRWRSFQAAIAGGISIGSWRGPSTDAAGVSDALLVSGGLMLLVPRSRLCCLRRCLRVGGRTRTPKFPWRDPEVQSC